MENSSPNAAVALRPTGSDAAAALPKGLPAKEDPIKCLGNALFSRILSYTGTDTMDSVRLVNHDYLEATTVDRVPMTLVLTQNCIGSDNRDIVCKSMNRVLVTLKSLDPASAASVSKVEEILDRGGLLRTMSAMAHFRDDNAIQELGISCLEMMIAARSIDLPRRNLHHFYVAFMERDREPLAPCRLHVLAWQALARLVLSAEDDAEYLVSKAPAMIRTLRNLWRILSMFA